MPATVFATVFIALFIGHQIGDYWTQTHGQAITKGKPGPAGRWACTGHVITLTLTKGAVLAAVALLLDLPLTAAGVALGFTVDASSHWWADRRATLARLARALGKGEFHDLGGPADPHAPVDSEGRHAHHLGHGAAFLDQSFHIAWLGAAALIIATV